MPIITPRQTIIDAGADPALSRSQIELATANGGVYIFETNRDIYVTAVDQTYVSQTSLVNNPGGTADGEVQIKTGTAFGADPDFRYNTGSDTLLVKNITGNGTATFTGLVNLGSNANVKVTGGSNGQSLVTDGTGNLRWQAAMGSGTVTSVQGNGTGLGFTLSGTVTAAGNIELAVPTSANLRANLNIGTVANANFDSNASNVLLGNAAFGTISQLVNGNSNVAVAANGNVGISVAGNANVLVITGNTVQLGAVGNVRITGGTANGQVLKLVDYANGQMTWGSDAGLVIANEYHVATNGSDSTGDGSQANPFATIGQAITSIGANTGYKIIVHAGSYVENVDIAVTNTSLVAAQSDIGASPLIQGTLTVSGTATAVKVQGITANVITITTSGTSYFTQTKAANAVSKTGTGYTEVIDSDWAVVGNGNAIFGNTLFDAGTTITNGTKLANVQVQGTAIINIKNSIQVGNVILNGAGAVASIDDSYVYAPSIGANAVRVINGALTARSSLFLEPDLTPARIGIDAGFLGYDDISFDKDNSTLGAGLNATAYFQDIDAENITTSGNITIGSGVLAPDSDNLEVRGYDNFNVEVDGVVNIYTDASGTTYQWQFGDDGTLTTPGDITVGGDVTGRAAANTLVLKAQPTTDTYIQLNSIVDSEIRTAANLQIRTDSGNTPYVWNFDSTGVLTTPGDVVIDGGLELSSGILTSATNTSFQAANGGLLSLSSTDTSTTSESAVRVYVDTADNANNRVYIYTDNQGTGDLGAWTFAPDGTLSLPGATAFIDASANFVGIYPDASENNGIELYTTATEIFNTGNVNISANVAGTGKTWTFANTGDLTAPGNITAVNANLGNAATANFFIGSGANLTSLPGANVTGAVAFATTANAVALANVSGAGNIAAVNLDGNASNVLRGNGVFAAPPAVGANGLVQFADNGLLAWDTQLAYSTATERLSTGNLTVANVANIGTANIATAALNTVNFNANVTANIATWAIKSVDGDDKITVANSGVGLPNASATFAVVGAANLQGQTTIANLQATVTANADTPSGNLVTITINGVAYQLLAV